MCCCGVYAASPVATACETVLKLRARTFTWMISPSRLVTLTLCNVLLTWNFEGADDVHVDVDGADDDADVRESTRSFGRPPQTITAQKRSKT